ncbi:hypothetical protein TNCV_1818841 [Trichonephila clavipes]|nr:hypothetical protein TNCV_1818841 [Trichonephila clavipes]
MSIILKDDIPVCVHVREPDVYLVLEKLQVNDQIDAWLQQGIIRESCSDYCSPIVLCKKSHGAMKRVPLQLPFAHPFTYGRFSSGLHEKEISTAADSVRSGWPLWNQLWESSSN